jgi:hypothetical protein
MFFIYQTCSITSFLGSIAPIKGKFSKRNSPGTKIWHQCGLSEARNKPGTTFLAFSIPSKLIFAPSAEYTQEHIYRATRNASGPKNKQVINHQDAEQASVNHGEQTREQTQTAHRPEHSGVNETLNRKSSNPTVPPEARTDQGTKPFRS